MERYESVLRAVSCTRAYSAGERVAFLGWARPIRRVRGGAGAGDGGAGRGLRSGSVGGGLAGGVQGAGGGNNGYALDATLRQER
jgi:hypothetical protein